MGVVQSQGVVVVMALSQRVLVMACKTKMPFDQPLA
jgi:hypothetical protein